MTQVIDLNIVYFFNVISRLFRAQNTLFTEQISVFSATHKNVNNSMIEAILKL